jgi:endonuclease/exonuclease/phosphatase family metal-dependent hydrolase
MIALTVSAALMTLAPMGCHRSMTRVIVDDQAAAPRTFEDAMDLAGVEPGRVALSARRDLQADVDSRSDRLSVLSFNMHHRDEPDELAIMNTAANLADELDYFCRGTKRTSDREGLAIISRYPFRYYAERHLKNQTSRALLGFNRVSVMGEFNVPEVGRVRVVNVHFTNWGFEERVRRGQLTETLQWVAERQSEVPADLIIFGGDFNIEPSWDELDLMHDRSVTGGIVYHSHNDPQTETFGSKGNPKKRVDYIYIAEPLRPTGVAIVDEEVLWPAGIRLAGSNKRLHLSDHLPVLQEFRVPAPREPAAALANVTGE